MSPRITALEFTKPAKRAAAATKDIVDEADDLLAPAVAGCLHLISWTWGSAALHPRLYAFATLRGLPKKLKVPNSKRKD